MPSSEIIAAAALFHHNDVDEVARQAERVGALALAVRGNFEDAVWLWTTTAVRNCSRAEGDSPWHVVWTSVRYVPDRFHVIEVFPFVDVDNTGYRVIDSASGEAVRFSGQYGDATWSSKSAAERHARDLNNKQREHQPRASRA